MTENTSTGSAHISEYETFLQEELRDPELAAAYLTVALTEGSAEDFLLALRSVADAHGGLGAVAEAADLNRQTLYRTLSGEGNPTLSTLRSVLRVLGLPPSAGLLDVLEGKAAVPEVLLRTDIDKLTVLPAGTPAQHATELLASDA